MVSTLTDRCAAAPGELPGRDAGEPSAATIGGGVVWVRDGKRFHLFAIRDGAYLRSLGPGFFVEELHFDASRSEFWGPRRDAEPLVWSWSSGGGFERRRVPARQVYASYQAENGQRVIVFKRA